MKKVKIQKQNPTKIIDIMSEKYLNECCFGMLQLFFAFDKQRRMLIPVNEFLGIGQNKDNKTMKLTDKFLPR
jgi:hypothetical protein